MTDPDEDTPGPPGSPWTAALMLAAVVLVIAAAFGLAYLLDHLHH
jgi:hypothetical protein